jgi:uncharacterized protein YkuJ
MRPFRVLSDDEKRAYLQYDVVVRDLGAVDSETIVEVFTRINSTSYDLNAIELHNARYDGAFKKFGERVSELQFFENHRVFTATDIRRMNDLRFSLWVCITLLSSYFHRDDELEPYLNQYNDSSPHDSELFRGLNSVFTFIEDCRFPDSCRCWKKADLFTLIVEIHRALIRDRESITPVQINGRLIPFYDQVDNIDPSQPTDSIVYAYYKAALQASNDRSNRIRRGEIITSIIRR